MTAQNVSDATPPSRRETGKVARLPVEIRNLVNQALRGGQRYEEIIAELQAHGFPHLTRWNIARWRRGGYAHWLRDQETFERLHQLPTEGNALLGQLDPTGASPTADLAEALLATQLNQMLLAFDDATRADRPEDYFRLCRAVTAFMTARALRQRANLERAKYQREIRQSKPQSKPTNSGLSEEQLAKIKDRLNRIA
jgi:hypothetical protein